MQSDNQQRRLGEQNFDAAVQELIKATPTKSTC